MRRVGAIAPLLECNRDFLASKRLEIPALFGGGGGNRTRVRMVSGQRVYVRSFRPISVGPVAETWRSAHLDRLDSRPRLRSVSGRGPAF